MKRYKRFIKESTEETKERIEELKDDLMDLKDNIEQYTYIANDLSKDDVSPNLKKQLHEFENATLDFYDAIRSLTFRLKDELEELN